MFDRNRSFHARNYQTLQQIILTCYFYICYHIPGETLFCWIIMNVYNYCDPILTDLLNDRFLLDPSVERICSRHRREYFLVFFFYIIILKLAVVFVCLRFFFFNF